MACNFQPGGYEDDDDFDDDGFCLSGSADDFFNKKKSFIPIVVCAAFVILSFTYYGTVNFRTQNISTQSLIWLIRRTL